MKDQHYSPTPPREKIIPTELEPGSVRCGECAKEIPDSVAVKAEGDDYVRHFCGLECYRKWSTRHEKELQRT